mmetsp:Transcript_24989/g.77064  ORF Transcript_24989/g.77064 Transcript_24989/m.77064 type:complete len:399 (-) Transcript_24989:942-2138(-)
MQAGLWQQDNLPAWAVATTPQEHAVRGATPVTKQIIARRCRAKLCIRSAATGTTGVPLGSRVSKSQRNDLQRDRVLRRRAQLPDDAADIAARAKADWPRNEVCLDAEALMKHGRGVRAWNARLLVVEILLRAVALASAAPDRLQALTTPASILQLFALLRRAHHLRGGGPDVPWLRLLGNPRGRLRHCLQHVPGGLHWLCLWGDCLRRWAKLGGGVRVQAGRRTPARAAALHDFLHEFLPRLQACVGHVTKPMTHSRQVTDTCAGLDDCAVGAQRALRAGRVPPLGPRVGAEQRGKGDLVHPNTTLHHLLQPELGRGPITRLGMGIDHAVVRHLVRHDAGQEGPPEPLHRALAVAAVRAGVEDRVEADEVGRQAAAEHLVHPALGALHVSDLGAGVDD